MTRKELTLMLVCGFVVIFSAHEVKNMMHDMHLIQGERKEIEKERARLATLATLLDEIIAYMQSDDFTQEGFYTKCKEAQEFLNLIMNDQIT